MERGKILVPSEGRTFICIDLKSYYASCECIYRGLDPLTTNLLVADETRSDKTIVLAVSPTLKALGVPGRSRLFEAKQKIREAEARLHRHIDYIIAPPRMAAYIQQSAEIYKILPFSALKGYDDALAEQETIYVERDELGEIQKQELDKKLRCLIKAYRVSKRRTKYMGGDGPVHEFLLPRVEVRFFQPVPEQGGKGQYRTVEGAVIKLDLQQKQMVLRCKGEADSTAFAPTVDVQIPLLNIDDYRGELFSELSPL